MLLHEQEMRIITNRIEVGEQYENKYRISIRLSIHEMCIRDSRITQDIIENVRSKRKMYIGEQTAEEIKQKIGNAMVVKDAETISVSGRDVETGLPHAIEINSNEVESYIRGSLQEIVHATKTILEVTPPELASDIAVSYTHLK